MNKYQRIIVTVQFTYLEDVWNGNPKTWHAVASSSYMQKYLTTKYKKRKFSKASINNAFMENASNNYLSLIYFVSEIKFAVKLKTNML